MKSKKRKSKDSLKVYCMEKFHIELSKFVKQKFKDGFSINEVAKLLKCSYAHAHYLKDKFNCKYKYPTSKVKHKSGGARRGAKK